MKKTPLQIVKERFESKEKLVEAVQALATEELFLDNVNDVKGLGRVSNQKLLKLHDTLTWVKENFGTREKLVSEICDVLKRKDAGFKARLEGHSTPRLVDELKSARKRRAAADAKAAKAPTGDVPKAKKSKSKKAKAKAAA